METYKKITQCIKCGYQSNIMRSPMIDTWMKILWAKEIGGDDQTIIERIKRKCPNCGYYWYELPIDQKG